MPDRKKVVEALECCLDIVKSGRWASGCISCPYAEEKNNCREKMIREAIELLKEQETKKKNRLPYPPDSNVQWT